MGMNFLQQDHRKLEETAVRVSPIEIGPRSDPDKVQCGCTDLCQPMDVRVAKTLKDA